MRAALQAKAESSSSARSIFTPVRSGLLQRKCACGGTPGLRGECESCRKKRESGTLLRATAHPSSRNLHTSEVPPIVHEVLRSPGQPLDAGTRAFMEPRFGHDFGRVRIHAGAQTSSESARALGALAFTVGRHVVFAAGQHAPGTNEGKKLLAHELTHVVQQRAESNPKGNAAMASDAYEQQAERTAQLVLQPDLVGSLPSRLGEAVSRISFAPAIIQRQEDPKKPGARPGGLDPTSNPAAAALERARLLGEKGGAVPPEPELDSCDPTQTNEVKARVAVARNWINYAQPRIAAFINSATSPADAQVVTSVLTDNFHTTAASSVSTISSNFSSLKDALNGPLDLECLSSSSCDKGDLAYVRGTFAFVRRLGDVNLCPFYFECGNVLVRSSTIIHEVAHQYPGADDKAYEDQRAYNTLSVADAMDNADSYAVAARQIFHKGLFGPGQSC
jgi:hypothetical protein